MCPHSHPTPWAAVRDSGGHRRGPRAAGNPVAFPTLTLLFSSGDNIFSVLKRIHCGFPPTAFPCNHRLQERASHHFPIKPTMRMSGRHSWFLFSQCCLFPGHQPGCSGQARVPTVPTRPSSTPTGGSGQASPAPSPGQSQPSTPWLRSSLVAWGAASGGGAYHFLLQAPPPSLQFLLGASPLPETLNSPTKQQ